MIEASIDAHDEGPSSDEILTALVDDGRRGVFLQRLSLGRWQSEESSYQTALEILGAKPRLSLRSLVLGKGWDRDSGRALSFVEVGDASSALQRMPSLEVLKVHGNDAYLGRLHLPRLRELRVRTQALSRGTLAALASAKLPELERLELWLGERPDHDVRADNTALLGLLTRAELPKLRHLALCRSGDTETLVEMLCRSPLLERLETLSLARGNLGGEGAELLVRSAKRFEKLQRLDVSANRLPVGWIGQLTQELAPRVAAADQRPLNDEDRYDAIRE